MLVEKNQFKKLDPLAQERLFAPCCLSREQLWTSGTDWSGDEIDDIVVGPVLERLSKATGENVRSMVRRLEYETPRDLIRGTLLEGDDFAVEFLMWFLEQSLSGVHCTPESSSNAQEPDLIVSHRGVPSCKVELKRVVSTSNLVDYAKSFTEKKWQKNEPNRPSILLLVFPLLSVDSWRAETLTQGYIDFCEEIPGWHDESMYAYSVTAPLEFKDDTENLPLELITQFVEDHVP